MRLGAYVWYGFSYTGGHYTDRLFGEFPGREPEWGWTEDSTANMEYQISLAVKYGLSFFAFDWYYGKPHLNRAVDRFLEAEGHENMEFCLMVGNHGSAHIYRKDWEDACRYFVRYMSSPCALRINGRPVIVIYDITALIDDLGGIPAVKECLDYLRREMKRETGCDIVICGCECPFGTPGTGAIDYNTEAFSDAELAARLKRDRECGFDALTGYNYRRYSPVDGSYEVPYRLLTEQHERCWDKMAEHAVLPYSPCILAGWDCRPWETEWWGNTTGYRSCYAPDRDGVTFAAHIKNAAVWIKDHPGCAESDLGFIYAWDEVCEGGFMIPTKGEGYAMLEGLKSGSEAADRVVTGKDG